MKKYIKLSCICLLAISCGITVSCTKDNGGGYPKEEPVYVKSADKVFYVAAFTAPPKINAASYQLVKDCGIDYIYLDPWANSTSVNNENQIVAALEAAGEAGVKVLIMPNNSHDHHIGDAYIYNESGVFEKYISYKDYQVDYTQYDAFAGFYAFDEPDSLQFDWIANDYQDYEQSKYAGYRYLVTAMSSDSDHRNKDEFIHLYFESVLKNTQGVSRAISFDDYPLAYNVKTDTVYIEDDAAYMFNIVSHYCMEYGIDFYNFMQTLGYGFGTSRMPETLEDIRWQLALTLAFGGKGIQCFTYRSLANAGFTESMVTATGIPTDIYYFCKQTFTEMHNWEEVYMSFNYTGTIAHNTVAPSANPDDISNLPYALEGHKRIKSINSTRDLLIGTFKDENGYDGFSFCTYNDPYYQKYNQIDVTFNYASKAVMYLNGEKSVVNLKNGKFSYEINAGDVLFVIPLE